MRHDSQHLARIKEHCGYEHFIHLREKPFFYFDRSPKEFYRLPSASTKGLQLIPFNHFTWINQLTNVLHEFRYDPEKLELSIIDYYNPLKVDKVFHQFPEIQKGQFKPPPLMIQAHKFYFEKDLLQYDVFQGENPTDVDIGRFTYIFMAYKNKKIVENNAYIELLNNATTKRDKAQEVSNDLLAEIRLLSDIFIKAEERSKRLVSIRNYQPKTVKTKSKKSYERYSASHHYVYMDSAPAAVLTTSGDEPPSNRRGHHRRSHWRTLSSPRYRHHPKFGQRIRVKAAWIGPKEWVDDGKIYTVHDDEDLD